MELSNIKFKFNTINKKLKNNLFFNLYKLDILFHI